MLCRKGFVELILLASIAGCGSSGDASYKPNATAAKDALTAALTAWRSGGAMAPVKLASGVAVQPQDSDWKAGKKLTKFAIGEEKPTADGPTQIEVQLTLAGNPQPIGATYFVVGRDPLWVFRDRDYQHATGM